MERISFFQLRCKQPSERWDEQDGKGKSEENLSKWWKDTAISLPCAIERCEVGQISAKNHSGENFLDSTSTKSSVHMWKWRGRKKTKKIKSSKRKKKKKKKKTKTKKKKKKKKKTKKTNEEKPQEKMEEAWEEEGERVQYAQGEKSDKTANKEQSNEKQ